MKIKICIKDAYNKEINIGDKVELFDWGKSGKLLGIVTVIWDTNEGRISCHPCIVEDPYDFVTKALPRCRKLNAC
jgi:hypothetical protein